MLVTKSSFFWIFFAGSCDLVFVKKRILGALVSEGLSFLVFQVTLCESIFGAMFSFLCTFIFFLTVSCILPLQCITPLSVWLLMLDNVCSLARQCRCMWLVSVFFWAEPYAVKVSLRVLIAKSVQKPFVKWIIAQWICIAFEKKAYLWDIDQLICQSLFYLEKSQQIAKSRKLKIKSLKDKSFKIIGVLFYMTVKNVLKPLSLY